MWANIISKKPVSTHDREIADSLGPPETLLRFFELRPLDETNIASEVQEIPNKLRIAVNAFLETRKLFVLAEETLRYLDSLVAHLCANTTALENIVSAHHARLVTQQEDVDHL